MTSTAERALPERAVPRGAAFETIAIWAGIGAVGVFLVWLLTSIGSVTGALYRNPDNASALVIAQFLGDRGSGEVILGNYAWLEPLFGMHLTQWLPGHRELWEAAPFVAYAISIALVGFVAARAVSTRAGIAVALAMAAPAPLVLGFLAVPNAHAPALLHIALLALFLLTLPALPKWGRLARALWAAVLVVTLAAGASSDVLLLIGGVVPFLAALAFGWRRAGVTGDIAALAAAACLGGVGGGLALAAWADKAGIHDTGAPIPLASRSHALDNVWRLLEGSAQFVHGRLGDTSGALDLVLEVAALMAVIALPLVVIGIVIRARPALAEPNRPAEQRLVLVYWGVAAAALSAAFILSSAPEDIGSVRYLTALWPAVLSLVVIAFGSRAIAAVALVAALTAVLGCFELAAGRYTQSADYPEADLRALERFVEANDLDRGYASYVNAPVITAQTDFAVRTYPVGRCGIGPGAFCRYGIHSIDAWYGPEPGARSFFVVAERAGWPLLGGPPARWGPPIDEAQLGPFHVYAYDYDLTPVLASGNAPTQRR